MKLLSQSICRIFLLITCFSLHAADHKDGPDELIAKSFQLLKEKKFAAYSELIHPSDLKAFVQMFSALRGPLLEEYNSAGPQEKKQTELVFGKDFFTDKFETLDDLTQAKSILTGVLTFSFKSMEQAGQAPSFLSQEVISKHLKNDIYFVSIRFTMRVAEQQFEADEVIRLQQHNGKWYIKLKPELKGFGEALSKQYKKPKQ